MQRTHQLIGLVATTVLALSVPTLAGAEEPDTGATTTTTVAGDTSTTTVLDDPAATTTTVPEATTTTTVDESTTTTTAPPPEPQPHPGVPVRCAPLGYDLVGTLNWANDHRNGHFAGADVTGSVALPGGRIAWLMGDTWVGPAANGTGGFLRNSILVQLGSCIEEHLGWDGYGWAGVLPAEDAEHFYWPNDGIVDGGRLHVVFTRYTVEEGLFLGGVPDGQFRAEIDLATFEVLSLTPVPGGAHVGLGSAFVPDGDVVHVYGQRDVPGTHMPELVLARFPVGGIAGPWEYWDGVGWSAEVDDLAAVLGPVMNTATQVNILDGQYVAIGQEGVFRDTVMAIYTAHAPQGPFTRMGTLMPIPDHDPDPVPEDGYVYLGGVHPTGRLDAIIAWNYNTFDTPDWGIGHTAFYGARYSDLPIFPTESWVHPVFNDVGGTEFYAAPSAWAAYTGITTGFGGSARLEPHLGATRGEIVTFLWRAHGAPRASAHPAFSDVNGDAYYADAVAWAVEEGITTGVGTTGRFEPHRPATRAEVVTFLWRAHGSPTSWFNPFFDVPTGIWYEPATTWAGRSGISTGVGGGAVFHPDTRISRAEVVTFLWRAHGTPIGPAAI